MKVTSRSSLFPQRTSSARKGQSFMPLWNQITASAPNRPLSWVLSNNIRNNMATLKIHTIETAPEDSRQALEEVQHKLGNVPNLYGTMANSPEMLKGYLALNQQWER